LRSGLDCLLTLRQEFPLLNIFNVVATIATMHLNLKALCVAEQAFHVSEPTLRDTGGVVFSGTVLWMAS